MYRRFDDVFTIKQITERRREVNLTFIDYDKAFDRVHRNKLRNIMHQRAYPIYLIQAIKSLYDETKVIIQQVIKLQNKSKQIKELNKFAVYLKLHSTFI